MTDDIKTPQDAAKHLLPFIEHLANGGSVDDIQEDPNNDGDWDYVSGEIIASTQGVISGIRYRFKPKPREWWAVVDSEGNGLEIKADEHAAMRDLDWWRDNGCCGPYSIVKVRGVL